MKKGCYRVYIHIPFTKLGIKFARLRFDIANTSCCFLTGMIMNILERKRYKRYMLGQNLGNYRWEICRDYNLNPTYFSFFGIFNLVKHVDTMYDEWQYKNNSNKVEKLLFKYSISPFCEGLIGCGIVDNKLVETDYGDFSIYAYKNDSVNELDYK